MLHGAQEVTIREEEGRVVIEPVGKTETEEADPIHGLGREPVRCSAPDAAEHHDRYLYGK
jgi:virulence-associated protein VagC